MGATRALAVHPEDLESEVELTHKGIFRDWRQVRVQRQRQHWKRTETSDAHYGTEAWSQTSGFTLQLIKVSHH